MSTEQDHHATLVEQVNAASVGMAALVAWHDKHPEIPLTPAGLTWIVADFLMDEPDHAAIVRLIADGARIGDVTKRTGPSTQETMFIDRDFGGGVKLQHQANREQVCERVVTGTETVEIPDPDAPKVTVEREIVEWECGSILAGADA